MIVSQAKTNATLWLPPEALTDGPLPLRLGEVVAAWSTHWFAQRRFGIVSELAPAGLGRATDARPVYLTLPGGLWLETDEEVGRAIASAMLNVELDPASLSASDKEVVERLALDAVRDLCARIAVIFGLVPSKNWSMVPAPRADVSAGAIACDIGLDEGGPMLRLMIEARLAVAARKSAMLPEPTHPPLRSVDESLGAQTLHISAFLGRCGLSLSEFSDLSVGDVLAFDRPTDEPLPLAINLRPKGGLCRLEQQGDAYALKIIQPFAG